MKAKPKAKTKMGRPPLPKAQRKAAEIKLRLSKQEKEAFTEAAGELSLSAWARKFLRRAAKLPAGD